MAPQKESQTKHLEKTISQKTVDFLRSRIIMLKNMVGRHLIWFIIGFLIFLLWFFWKWGRDSFLPTIKIDYRDYGSTTHNIIARLFRGSNPQDTTLSTNLIMSIGSIATAGSFILLWKDTEERKQYEKQQLEIQKLSYKPYLFPRSIHYYQSVSGEKSPVKFTLQKKCTLEMKLDSTRISKKLNGVEFDLYDVYNNDGICAIENVGRGMAGNIVVTFCKNKDFKQGIVEEVVYGLGEKRSMVIWKNKHYTNSGIDFDDKFYLKINYKSLWINDENNDSHIFEGKPIEFEYEKKDEKNKEPVTKIKGYYLTFKNLS
jgi:hypothetical protein